MEEPGSCGPWLLRVHFHFQLLSPVQVFAKDCSPARLLCPAHLNSDTAGAVFPSQGIFPNSGTELASLAAPALGGGALYHEHHSGSSTEESKM